MILSEMIGVVSSGILVVVNEATNFARGFVTSELAMSGDEVFFVFKASESEVVCEALIEIVAFVFIHHSLANAHGY